MISASKSEKMLIALKDYRKRYLTRDIGDLDESGTRIMINTFLSSILGYQELEEIKTEYMIKGTYADYIVQIAGTRYFLVEVKSFSLVLADKHLRQAVNYGANEGIEWALLTNGRQFQFYKILFEKPISERLVFDIDFMADDFNIKEAHEQLTYFHREAVIKKSLEILWSRFTALEPVGLAGLLFSPHVLTFLKRELRAKFDTRFEDDEIIDALTNIVCTEIPLDKLKIPRFKTIKKKPKPLTDSTILTAAPPVGSNPQSEEVIA